MKALNRRRCLVAVACLILLAVLFACAPRQASEEPSAGSATDVDEPVALELPTWSIDSDCASCHTSEVESGGDSACAYSQHTSEGCVSCHSDEGGLLATSHEDYATANQPTRLKKTEVADASCTSCHDSEEIKAATAGVTVLTDTKGTVVNPHDRPQTAEHEASVTCSDCHKMHKPEPPEETAPKACLSCHHMNVYECGTCHDYGKGGAAARDTTRQRPGCLLAWQSPQGQCDGKGRRDKRPPPPPVSHSSVTL